jgi:hypothetical protein
MTSETQVDSASSRPSDQRAPVPFGPAFFATVLSDRVREVCDGHPDPLPVVELHLADGYLLDVCHIAAIEQPWVAVAAFRDRETCEEMDLLFVPYAMIIRVSVSVRHKSERPAGFALPPKEAVGELS